MFRIIRNCLIRHKKYGCTGKCKRERLTTIHCIGMEVDGIEELETFMITVTIELMQLVVLCVRNLEEPDTIVATARHTYLTLHCFG